MYISKKNTIIFVRSLNQMRWFLLCPCAPPLNGCRVAKENIQSPRADQGCMQRGVRVAVSNHWCACSRELARNCPEENWWVERPYLHSFVTSVGFPRA
jgi:hypothetical protein